MSSLLTSNEILVATGTLSNHFDTFAISNIIIHKEPIATISNVSDAETMYGYENSSNEDNIAYTTVSGIFPAIVTENRKASIQELPQLQSRYLKGEIIVKVKQVARDYIKNGKTEMVELSDGRTFNTISDEAVQNYLGLKFYYFGLERTT